MSAGSECVLLTSVWVVDNL